jgi:hypothetical protein
MQHVIRTADIEEEAMIQNFLVIGFKNQLFPPFFLFCFFGLFTSSSDSTMGCCSSRAPGSHEWQVLR